MTVLAVGTAPGDIAGTSGPRLSTTTASLIGPDVGAGFRLEGDTLFTHADNSDVWYSWWYYPQTYAPSTATKTFFAIKDGTQNLMLFDNDSNGNARLRLVLAGTDTVLDTQLSVLNAANTKYRLDVHLKIAAAGVAEVYVDGTLHCSYSGDTTTVGASGSPSTVMNTIDIVPRAGS